jgi:hypothetical protein
MVEAAGAEPAGRTTIFCFFLVNGEVTGARPISVLQEGQYLPPGPKCGREALNPNGEGADF